MPNIKDKQLTVKQAAFCKWLYTPTSKTYGNGTESAREAGYKGTDNYLAMVASRNIRKDIIRAEKERIEAKIDEKIEHTRLISLQKLQCAYDIAKKQKNPSGMVAAVREADDISGLKSQQPATVAIDVRHSTAGTEQDVLRKRLGLLDRMQAQPTGIERN